MPRKPSIDAGSGAITRDALKDIGNPRALMALVAKKTGLRAGELAALHRDDIKDGFIHVHRQQIRNKDDDNHEFFFEVSYTKDERVHPHDGRYVPITPDCASALEYADRIAFNSRLIEKGFSASDRALILGHEVQTNENHYSLSDARRLESIKDRLV